LKKRFEVSGSRFKVTGYRFKVTGYRFKVQGLTKERLPRKQDSQFYF